MASSKFDVAGFLAGMLGGFSQQLQQERAQNEARQLAMLKMFQQNENATVEPANPAEVERTGGLLGALTGTGGGTLRTTGEPVQMVGNTPFVQRQVPFIEPPAAPTQAQAPTQAPATPPVVGPLSRPFAPEVMAQRPALQIGEGAPIAGTAPAAVDLLPLDRPQETEEQVRAQARLEAHTKLGRVRATEKGQQYLATRLQSAEEAAVKRWDAENIRAQREAEMLLKRVHSPELQQALQQVTTKADLATVKGYMAEHEEPNHLQDAATLVKQATPENRAAVVADVYSRLLEMNYKEPAIKAALGPALNAIEMGQKAELEVLLGNIRNRQRYELEAHLMPLKAAVARQTGLDAALQKPMEFQDRRKLGALGEAATILTALNTEFTPEERAKYTGAFGLKAKKVGFEQAINELADAPTDPKFNRFNALMKLALREIRGEAGANLTAIELDHAYGFLVTGKEWTTAEFEQKMALGLQRIPLDIDRSVRLAKTPLGALRREDVLGPPLTPTQSPTGVSGQPGQGSAGAIPAIPPGMKPGQTITLPDGTVIKRKN